MIPNHISNFLRTHAIFCTIRLSVGFAHGVMNTDNMSVASVTIDYAPFGFVDEYNPNFIPNTSDDTGRYDLESQASVPLGPLQY